MGGVAVAALLVATNIACALVPVNFVDGSYQQLTGAGGSYYEYTYTFERAIADEWALPFYTDPSSVITNYTLPAGWSTTVETNPGYWSSIYSPSTELVSYAANAPAYDLSTFASVLTRSCSRGRPLWWTA